MARTLLVVVAAGTFVAFFARWSWQAELLASFRPHLAVASLAAALGCLVLLRPLPALGLVLLAGLNAAPVLLAVGGPAPAAAPGAPTLLVGHQNAQGGTGAGGATRVLRGLAEHPVDVLVLLEPAPDWGAFLRAPARRMGYEVVLPSSGPADERVLVLSRVPLADVQVLDRAGLPPASVAITAPLGEQEVHLLGVHTRNPLTPGRWRLRDDQLDAIARWVEQQEDPVAVFGDLNVTPWSPTYTAFERRTGLVSSAAGRGLDVTWPHRTPWVRRLGIPIDHLLHSPDLTTTERRVEPTFGSEHGVLEVGLAPAD